MPSEEEMRDPNYCYTHRRICAPCPPPTEESR